MFASKFFMQFFGLGALVAVAMSTANAQPVAATLEAVPQAAAQAPAPAVPAPPIAFRTSAAASAIANINERMSVKEAELAELELDAKIVNKRAEIDNLRRGPSAPSDDGFTPTVLEIGGADGKLTASLVMHGGNVQTVRVGDMVGGWEVRKITVDALTLARGKETKRLAFGASPAPVAPPAAMPGPSAMGNFVAPAPGRMP